MTQLRDGDLVIHKPADPTKEGSGPFYVDRAERYGDNPTRIAVSLLVYGPLAWCFDLPKDEVEIIGHHEVPLTERIGNAFSPQVLGAMQPLIELGQQRLFELYPALKARFEAEEAERAADAAATPDQLTVGRTAAGWNAFAHCLKRGDRVVWTCDGHSAIDYPRFGEAAEDCAENELNRRHGSRRRK